MTAIYFQCKALDTSVSIQTLTVHTTHLFAYKHHTKESSKCFGITEVRIKVYKTAAYKIIIYIFYNYSVI